jgi:hypothetical protein
MPGNRDRQKGFQIPLLMEIAATAEVISAGRGNRSGDVAAVVDRVLDGFGYTDEQKSKNHHQSGAGVLYNDVMRAFDQLEEQRLVTRAKGRWVITASGLDLLRKHVRSLMYDDRQMPPSWLMAQKDDFGQDFFIHVARRLELEEWHQLLRNASTQEELFLSAFEAVHSSQIGGLLVEIWEVVLAKVVEGRRAAFLGAFDEI